MSMRRPQYNMENIRWIGAEAIGLPGQRTFRVMVMSDSMSAQLWLEKEQLQALADAVGRMLVEVDQTRGLEIPSRKEPVSNPKPPNFPDAPDIELHAGSLGLRYDPDQDVISLEAFDREADNEDDPSTFRCLGTRSQMEALQLNILEVVSAGRPRCPFCSTPLQAAGMPHFCPPMNGHQKITIDE